MQIALTSSDDISVLRIVGDIDMVGAPILANALETSSGVYTAPLIIDLTECPFIDSGGLNVLFQAVRRMGSSAWLGAVGVDVNVRRLFDTVGLTSMPRFRVLEGSTDHRD